MPWLNCLKCIKIFYAKPRHIKIGWGKFCSTECSYVSMKTGSYFACQICTKEIYRTKLDIQRSKSKKFFCSKSCFAIWKNQNMLRGDKNGNWKDGENAYRSMMLRHKQEPICADCGISNVKVLVVHHLDQNRKNNIISNLRWLCRNCHYLVHKGKTL